MGDGDLHTREDRADRVSRRASDGSKGRLRAGRSSRQQNHDKGAGWKRVHSGFFPSRCVRK
jgi:hypothetical protein